MQSREIFEQTKKINALFPGVFNIDQINVLMQSLGHLEAIDFVEGIDNCLKNLHGKPTIADLRSAIAAVAEARKRKEPTEKPKGPCELCRGLGRVSYIAMKDHPQKSRPGAVGTFSEGDIFTCACHQCQEGNLWIEKCGAWSADWMGRYFVPVQKVWLMADMKKPDREKIKAVPCNLKNRFEQAKHEN